MKTNEQEEFEFRLRMEQEAGQAAPERQAPSTDRMALQSVAKAGAGLVDMFGNLPTNVANLASAGVGTAAGVLGRPDITASRTIFEQPNFAQRGMEALGAIQPEFEPVGPGQRILDQAIQTGANLAVSPGSLARNVVTGLASGGAAGLMKEATGSDVAATAVGMLTPLALKGKTPTGTAVKMETLKDAQAVGYVVPPSTVKPTMVARTGESISGKAAINQEAAVRNQDITNKLAAKSLGLPEATAITESKLVQLREQAATPYREISAISKKAANALNDLKDARSEATAHYRHYDRSADPKSLRQAKVFSQKAESLEKKIEGYAVGAGRPELVEQLREARTKIAKTYDVERALNVGDGNIDAHVIGRMVDQGKPLTGELSVIGRFAQAFPSVTREGSRIPSPGVSGTDAGMAALLATAGYGAADGPAGLAAGALPLLRGPARSMLLSKPYQSRLVAPPVPLGNVALQSALAGRSISEQR